MSGGNARCPTEGGRFLGGLLKDHRVGETDLTFGAFSVQGLHWATFQWDLHISLQIEVPEFPFEEQCTVL